MEIISGFIETLKKKEYIKIDLIDTFWIGQLMNEGKWYFFASIGQKMYALSVHENEDLACDAMDEFVFNLGEKKD